MGNPYTNMKIINRKTAAIYIHNTTNAYEKIYRVRPN